MKSKSEDSFERREKLSIYLAKDDAAADGDLIEIEKTGERPVSLEAAHCKITLYGKRPVPLKYPKWANFLTTTNLTSLEGVVEQTTTTGAVLIIRAYKKTFIITFGSTFHIIKSEAIERDFGLRVTLNSVDPDKLRSLDKASYTYKPLNSRNQSTLDVDIFDLSVDSESDLVYAVTGASKVDIFGPQVTGRDALVVNPNVSLNTLHLVLSLALHQYQQPLPPQFAWVDNVSKVKDAAAIHHLDLELDKHLINKSSAHALWLGEPEIVSWEDQLGYSFDLRPHTERHVVLRLDSLKDYLGDRKIDFTCEMLKKQHVHVNDNEFSAIKTWSAYRCLYAEIKFGQRQFILRNGTWYQVDDDFAAKIDRQLRKIQAYKHALPLYKFDREDEYNEDLSKTDKTYTLLDKKNVKFGGAYSKIEFCDLVKGSKDFIHVKYYRSSSTLSHLFSQGLVAAETFVSDSEFRELLNKKLPAHLRLSDPIPRPDAGGYSVVYAIATNKKSLRDLPFFSKVTLKNTVKRLEGLGFKARVALVSVDPTVLVKKKGKPAKAKGYRARRA